MVLLIVLPRVSTFIKFSIKTEVFIYKIKKSLNVSPLVINTIWDGGQWGRLNNG